MALKYLKIFPDKNGFLHSGDLGIIDRDGFLKITGTFIKTSVAK